MRIEAGFVHPLEDVGRAAEGYTEEELAELKAQEDLKMYAEAIKKRQFDKQQIRETEEQLVDNKIMLGKVDMLLGKKTNIEKYITGGSSTAKPKFDVSESLASFDFEASVALSLREGTERPVEGSGDLESVIADSEIDRLFDDLDP